MPTQVYKAADGKRIPSVTTVLGHRKESEGLIHWAWQAGMAQLDYKELREEAAGAGTIAHAMVDRHIKGFDPFDFSGDSGTEEQVWAACTAFEGFSAWFDRAGIHLVSSEVSLVSERMRYGGTFDALGVIVINGKRSLVDWKTGRGLYGDAVAQVAAYAKLWDEHHPDQPIEDGGHVVRFDRETGAYQHVVLTMQDLENGWKAFVHLREVYDLDKELKRAIDRDKIEAKDAAKEAKEAEKARKKEAIRAVKEASKLAKAKLDSARRKGPHRARGTDAAPERKTAVSE